LLVEIVSSLRDSRVNDAAEVFYRSVALMRFEFQEGIGMADSQGSAEAARANRARRHPPARRSARSTTREALVG